MGSLRLGRFILIASGILFSAGACESAESPDRDRGKVPEGAGATNTGPPIGTGGFPMGETELEENFRSPVVSGPYLWSANPDTNRVARIDARTFDVDVLDGGHGPTFVAALPRETGPDGAAVINVFGNDASIFRDSGEMGGAGGSILSEVRLPIQRGASTWTVGANGRFAIVWSEFEQDLRGPLDGYQEMTVLSLDETTPEATRISVGFRPTRVVINQEETRAFVVSDPGFSVLDLTTDPPNISRELPLPDSPDGATRDVSFTPAGDLAFVRLNRSGEILIVRVEDDERVTVSLPKEATDLDLSADGRFAIAVMRGELFADTAHPQTGGLGGALGGQGGASEGGATQPHNSQIAVLPVPEIFEAPETYDIIGTPELVGSVVIAEEGNRAVFYTSAIDNSRVLTLNLDTLETSVSDLLAPVQAVFLSEDGKYGGAVMTPPPGSTSAGAFALFITEGDLPPRITGTATVPRFISIQEDRALITTWGSQIEKAAVFLGRFPQLSVDRKELEREPLASGMVPEAGQGFVAEAHPEGRVTFIDFDSAESTEVTGFELSSRVVEE